MGRTVLIVVALMLVAGDDGRGDERSPAPAPPAKIEPPPPVASDSAVTIIRNLCGLHIGDSFEIREIRWAFYCATVTRE
jgi:hypothetical protein